MLKKRNNFAIAVLGAAVFFITIAAFLFLPFIRQIRGKGVEYKSLSQQLDSGYKYLEFFQRNGAGKKLIAQADTASLIDTIAKEGRKYMLILKTISQKDPIGLGNTYAILPLEMEIEADFKQLGLFFQALEANSDAFVSVNKFTIRYDEKITPKLSVSLTLHIYFSKG